MLDLYRDRAHLNHHSVSLRASSSSILRRFPTEAIIRMMIPLLCDISAIFFEAFKAAIFCYCKHFLKTAVDTANGPTITVQQHPKHQNLARSPMNIQTLPKRGVIGPPGHGYVLVPKWFFKTVSWCFFLGGNIGPHAFIMNIQIFFIKVIKINKNKCLTSFHIKQKSCTCCPQCSSFYCRVWCSMLPALSSQPLDLRDPRGC